jgi:hypothetical protein
MIPLLFRPVPKPGIWSAALRLIGIEAGWMYLPNWQLYFDILEHAPQ